MQTKTSKIIAAHDLSGVGMASLSAVIPIISAMGSVVCPLPTAVLSSITGVFEGYTIVDLIEFMKKSITHWDKLGITFDYIYSGFLGSSAQVDVILSLVEKYAQCYFVVDPVFADDGKLYPTMDYAMVENMRRLVEKADLITPNITEAQFLLDEDKPPQTEKDIKNWLIRLCDMGPKKAVITSVQSKDNMMIVAYDKVSNEFLKLENRYIDVCIHGTGDVFTSVVVGALARGDGFGEAISLAASFVYEAINATLECGTPLREGILIPRVLPMLYRSISNSCESF